MTAKELFAALDFKEKSNNKFYIEYIDDTPRDGDYVYVIFYRRWKEYEIGYFDGFKTKTKQPTAVTIKEYQAITKQMVELGWI